MAATRKDYVAEAQDIHDHLLFADAVIAAAYIQARCRTLSDMDSMFSSDRFTYTALHGHDRKDRP